jgi:hypothetical protein
MTTIDELWMPSPNYGTANPGKIKGALHTTEGADTIQSLGNWFGQSAAQCSSHHGADNYTTTFGAYVFEDDTAWTQGGMNGVCVSIELCGYASYSRDTWLGSKLKLTQNASRWVRYMSDKYGIPMIALNSSQAQDSWTKGFCQHVNFGSKGSGHHDCGNGFPMDKVLEWAKSGTTQPPKTEDTDMAASVAYYKGKPYFAFVGPDNILRVNGGIVDPANHSKSGAGIAIDADSGRKIVTFTNSAGKLCTYEQAPGASNWTWKNTGWDTQ